MRAHRFSNRAVLLILLKSSLSIPLGCRSYTADGREAGGTKGSDWLPTQFVQFSCRLHALGIAVAACVPDSLAYIGILRSLRWFRRCGRVRAALPSWSAWMAWRATSPPFCRCSVTRCVRGVAGLHPSAEDIHPSRNCNH